MLTKGVSVVLGVYFQVFHILRWANIFFLKSHTFWGLLKIVTYHS